jgi:hypothetical protein
MVRRRRFSSSAHGRHLVSRKIQEFAALLAYVEVGRNWDGVYFRAVASEAPDQSDEFQFCRHSDGITFSFPNAEWRALKEVFSVVLQQPDVISAIEARSL